MDISEGSYNGKSNPHARMSAENTLIYMDNIRDALIKCDPDDIVTYRDSTQNYKAKVQQILALLHTELAKLPADKRWLVTGEDASSCLARDNNLKELYLWPINVDQQGMPKQIHKVIDAIREHHIPAVSSESTVPDRPARQVARESDARYGGMLYVDSLSAADSPVPTYLDLLCITTQTIVNDTNRGLGNRPWVTLRSP